MQRIVDLKSPRGQELLNEVKTAGEYFQPNILHIFEKQKGSKNCGIQSSSLLLNSAYIGKTNLDNLEKSSLPYLEEKMFSFDETQKIKTQDGVLSDNGMTLKDVGDLLKSHGNDVEIHLASDSSPGHFKDCLKKVLGFEDSSAGIIINYHMATLGQEPDFGHHSPLAGYHPGEDRVLLMDTWYKTQECWATVDAMFEAMNTMDSASGQTRGFCLFKHCKKN